MPTKLALALATTLLTGCASGCHTNCLLGVIGPGNSVFDLAGDHYNRQDPCQIQEFSSATGARLKPSGYSVQDMPDYCFRGRPQPVRRVILDSQGRPIYLVR